MGSEAAGQTKAIWHTLIESCRRRRADPWKYLVWIFEELPTVKVTAETFASYTPKAYAKSHSQPLLNTPQKDSVVINVVSHHLRRLCQEGLGRTLTV